MAMRNPRLLIFAANMSALFVMTVLSAYLGHVIPSILSPEYTRFGAGILFLIFGIKMLIEAKNMTGKETQEELEEVTQELMEEMKDDDPVSLLEAQTSIKKPTLLTGIRNFLNYLLSPVFVSTFVMVFLAEWGDRSQIASNFDFDLFF
jgi:putative Ca2+/H+ antiporter (TMEM165/GDT1 family)